MMKYPTRARMVVVRSAFEPGTRGARIGGACPVGEGKVAMAAVVLEAFGGL